MKITKANAYCLILKTNEYGIYNSVAIGNHITMNTYKIEIKERDT